MQEQYVTRQQIAAALRGLGIKDGHLLHAHSSLSAFGWVEGGAEAVVDALLDTVGFTGTVMVPTFNHSRVDVFDPLETPSFSGAVTEALRRRPTACRSVHPTHPYSAIGERAAELTEGHLEVGTYDRGCPLGKLADRGGWVALLGVGMRVNTCVHVGQASARAPCLGYGRERALIRLGGRVEEVRATLWRKGRCPFEWAPVEDRMRQRNMVADGRVGGADIHVMRGRDIIEVTVELCGEHCPTCSVRPDWTHPQAIWDGEE
jgi:aminoglycoside 3-N-acetyltransferase